jgi:hypothetical protein
LSFIVITFEREYNLKYLGLIGNVFHTKDIDAAIEKGKSYSYDLVEYPNSFTPKSMGIDPGWGLFSFWYCCHAICRWSRDSNPVSR